MILTIALNPALDVTYRLEQVDWHQTNRVAETAQRAGGKGLNVARVLHALGAETVATGLAGGSTGAAIRDDAANAGIKTRLVQISGESRRTVAVVEEAGSTLFNERGPSVTSAEWLEFLDTFTALLAGDCRVVVLSGSLPLGVPDDAYAILATMAREAGVPVLLDAAGSALLKGLGGRPAIAKPNLAELEEAVGRGDLPEAVARLRVAGAEAAVVTLGAEGIFASSAEGTWRARTKEPVSGNPTGAGDAVAAALALGIVQGRSWPDRLADATALGAAAVLAPLAGDFDARAYRDLRATVCVEKA